MRIVVTGASGNVGTALLLRLAARDEHEIVAVSRRHPPEAAPYSWADWRLIDIGSPNAESRLRDTFRVADAVVHLAWAIQPSRAREVMRATNQDGTAAVTRAVIEAGVPHFVHQSSVGAYSPAAGRTVTESWPTDGIPTSTYSVDKAAAERIVDDAEPHATVTRMRPALIFQDAAASEISRYFLGPFVPLSLVGPRVLRFAPLPQRIAFQAVHADDVAAAIERVLDERAGGAFNVAADPVIDRDAFRAVFGGVGPSVPPRVLRAVASATWHARLQPTEPGWIDLATESPLLDTTRLHALGWRPTRDAGDVLGRFTEALHRGAGRPGPLLHRRHRHDARAHAGPARRPSP